MIIPKLTNSITSAAIKTPRLIAIMLFFLSKPRNHARTVPVHAPVAGNGMPTNNTKAKNPYAERILRDIYFLKRFEKWNGNDVDFCLRLLANFEADNKTGEGTGPRWAVSYDEHLKEIDSILLSLIKGYHHNS